MVVRSFKVPNPSGSPSGGGGEDVDLRGYTCLRCGGGAGVHRSRVLDWDLTECESTETGHVPSRSLPKIDCHPP